jgi:hypothetical protein
MKKRPEEGEKGPGMDRNTSTNTSLEWWLSDPYTDKWEVQVKGSLPGRTRSERRYAKPWDTKGLPPEEQIRVVCFEAIACVYLQLVRSLGNDAGFLEKKGMRQLVEQLMRERQDILGVYEKEPNEANAEQGLRFGWVFFHTAEDGPRPWRMDFEQEVLDIMIAHRFDPSLAQGLKKGRETLEKVGIGALLSPTSKRLVPSEVLSEAKRDLREVVQWLHWNEGGPFGFERDLEFLRAAALDALNRSVLGSGFQGDLPPEIEEYGRAESCLGLSVAKAAEQEISQWWEGQEPFTPLACYEHWVPEYLKEVRSVIERHVHVADVEATLVDLSDEIRNWRELDEIAKNRRYYKVTPEHVGRAQRNARRLAERIQEELHVVFGRIEAAVNEPAQLRWMGSTTAFVKIMKALTIRGYVELPGGVGESGNYSEYGRQLQRIFKVHMKDGSEIPHGRLMERWNMVKKDDIVGTAFDLPDSTPKRDKSDDE